MSENMICPSCSKFQPRAEVCVECGVVIAKAQQAAAPKTEKTEESKADASDSSSLPLVAGAVFVVAAIGGYIFFSGDEPVSTPSDPAQTTALQDATSGRLQHAASTIQLASTREKMRALMTKLNMVAIEDPAFDPPTTEQGFNKLVQDGVLSRADIKDAWGRDFIYEFRITRDMGALGKEYEIRFHSAGPDGISGNADDVGL